MLDINRAMTTLRKIKSAKDIDFEETLIGIEITDASRDRLEQMVKDEFLAGMAKDLKNAFSSNDLGVVFAMLKEDCVVVDVETINNFHILDRIKVTDNIQKILENIIEYQTMVQDDVPQKMDRIFRSDNLGEIFMRLQEENIDIDLKYRTNLFDGIEITDSTQKAVQELVDVHNEVLAAWFSRAGPASQVEILIKSLGVSGTEIRETLMACEDVSGPEM